MSSEISSEFTVLNHRSVFFLEQNVWYEGVQVQSRVHKLIKDAYPFPIQEVRIIRTSTLTGEQSGLIVVLPQTFKVVKKDITQDTIQQEIEYY